MRPQKTGRIHKKLKKRKPKGTISRAIASVCLTFAIAGLFGVVGYSVAKPLLRNWEATEEDSTASISMESSAQPVQTEAASEQTTTAPQEESVAQTAVEQLTGGVMLPASALRSADTLQTYLEQLAAQIPQQTAVIVPLKVQGGALLYHSNSSAATQANIAQGTMTLQEIADLVQQYQYAPYASYSLLSDQLMPQANAETSYLVGSERWIDNNLEDGGKPWMNPFAPATSAYLTELLQEAQQAGFSGILCADVTFPPFRESDIAYIGDSVQPQTRWSGLTDLMKTLTSSVQLPVYLEISGTDLQTGTPEVLHDLTVWAPETVVVQVPDACTETEWAAIQKAMDAFHLPWVAEQSVQTAAQTQAKGITKLTES